MASKRHGLDLKFIESIVPPNTLELKEQIKGNTK